MTSESTRSDAWERWLPAWHAVYVASLVIALILGVSGGKLVGSVALAALVLTAVALAWYAVFFVRARPWAQSTARMIVYCAGAIALWVALASIADTYYLLQFAIFAQLFFALPRRAAIAAAVAFMTLVALHRVATTPLPIEQQLPDLVAGVLFTAFFIVLGGWIGSIIDQSAERQGLIAELESRRLELAALERQTGMLEERQRLAREIHDTLAQGFTSVVLHLEAAEPAIGTEPATARRHVVAARDAARSSLAEARRFVWALRPPALERQSLPGALESLLRRWSDESGVTGTFTVTGPAAEMHPDIEVTLLRAAQESLANIRRHANARSVRMTLSFLGETVSLDVRDDGVGFDPDRVRLPADGDSGGYGLVGLRERATRLGGAVAIESRPGDGTTIAVALPALLPPPAPPTTAHGRVVA